MKKTLAAVVLLTAISAVSAHAGSCQKECAGYVNDCPQAGTFTKEGSNGNTITYVITVTPVSGEYGSGEYPDCKDCDGDLVFNAATPDKGICVREPVTIHYVRNTWTEKDDELAWIHPGFANMPTAPAPCTNKWWTSGDNGSNKCNTTNITYDPS